MKRCPECHRFGVEVNSEGVEQCVWKNCRWKNVDNIDLSKINHPITHHKFINMIKRKTK